MTAAPVLRLAGVCKSFGSPDNPTPVLQDVDLCLQAGDKASLIGPSGCGKSTLLALVGGLLRPDAGHLEIGGVPMGDLDDRQRSRLRADQVGIALQSDNLIPFLTVRENVEVALSFASSKARRAASSRADVLLERVSVADRRDHLPRQLSGGEARRVALAVAMANQPDLLLADEVVANLDAASATEVAVDILAADFTVLFVTHDETIAALFDHRLVLHEHRLRRT